MIHLHTWPTPNGWKVAIMLEECGLPYRLVPVPLGEGAQLAPDFAAISPNNRVPAIVDDDPPDGAPFAVFESGAILLYLAERTGRFMPADWRGRSIVTQWLMWQMSALGPMVGQSAHFSLYAGESVPYAVDRFAREVRRLYAVLDGQLARTGDGVAGAYSIADMAIFPWTMSHKRLGLNLDDFPAVKRWYAALRARPAVQAGLAAGRELGQVAMTEEARRTLFGAPGAGTA